jgi:general secretion pathway protein D
LGETITISGIEFPNVGAIIQAFQSDGDVHIISTPQIMTTDNEEAEIVVATNIPFLTRQERSEAGLDYSNYEFKDVGATLKITPQINQERFVRLKIYQEIAQVVEQEEIGLPTTLKRQAETTVIVKDGNTVVIGGLIDETLTDTTYRVPCLGNIPMLGWLFKSVGKNTHRTNLFIFLTPHIVENPVEAERIYEEKKEQIDKVREGAIKMYERPDREAELPEVGVDEPETPEGEEKPPETIESEVEGQEIPADEIEAPEAPEDEGEEPKKPKGEEEGSDAPEGKEAAE